MKIIAIALFVLGCGSSATPLDDAGNPITDAPHVMPPPTPGLVEMPLDCQPFMREVHHVSTDNSRDVTINRFATVALAPGADFVLSKCDTQSTPTCSGSDVCTGSLEPAASQVCGVSRGSASFYDGALTILCGTRTERYSGSGTLTNSSETTFTVKLEVFQ
jgi:hypothetical protein